MHRLGDERYRSRSSRWIGLGYPWICRERREDVRGLANEFLVIYYLLNLLPVRTQICINRLMNSINRLIENITL